MASSAQSRLERLFPGRPMVQLAADGLGFAERELLQYRRRQEEILKSETIDHESGIEGPTDADDLALSTAEDISRLQLKKPVDPRRQLQALQKAPIPGTKEDEIVFVPHGLGRGGPAATSLDIDYENVEPVSSSTILFGRFCIFSLVIKFVYKYLQDPGSRISQRFFAGGKIFRRSWSLHYVFGPEPSSAKPLLLVPYEQVEQLVLEIGKEFNITMEVPPYPFQIAFFKDGTPMPQLLGTVNSKDDSNELQSCIPTPPLDYCTVPANASDQARRDHTTWKTKVEQGLAMEKRKKSNSSRKKVQNRQLTVIEHANQLERAQRYLGLRQGLTGADETGQTTSAENSGTVIRELDTSTVAPFPFEHQPVIICFDVECYEWDHNIITEIGVSTLDTTDLLGIAPGQDGENWVKQIRSRHFRIKGREQLRNTQFVHGNPDMFQFGTSEFFAIDEAAEAIDACFVHPYSADFQCSGPPMFDVHGDPIARSDSPLKGGGKTTDAAEIRDLLLLGHSIENDLAYLSSLGSTIFGEIKPHMSSQHSTNRRERVRSSIRESLDTAALHKAYARIDQPISLTKLCYELDITAWHAHNAGNDARYTLEAFIKIAIKARQQYDDARASDQRNGAFDTHQAEWELEKEKRIEQRMQAAKQQILLESETDEAAMASATSTGYSPFFQQAENDSTLQQEDRITFEEATRRYLEKSSADGDGGW